MIETLHRETLELLFKKQLSQVIHPLTSPQVEERLTISCPVFLLSRHTKIQGRLWPRRNLVAITSDVSHQFCRRTTISGEETILAPGENLAKPRAILSRKADAALFRFHTIRSVISQEAGEVSGSYKVKYL